MTLLMDAMAPDSPSRRHYAAMVDGLLMDAPHFNVYHDNLAREFTELRNLRPAMDVIIDRSPI